MRFDSTRLPIPPSGMNEVEFIAAFGALYERSPWVARETWRRGQCARRDSIDELADELAATVDAADRATRLALIRAHPELAGRAARRGMLGTASTSEQAESGIDQCSDTEYQRFQALNEAYKEKFGFPFVMAVKGKDRWAILSEFETRLGNEVSVEFQQAIAEIHRIARLRLLVFAGPVCVAGERASNA